jgi:hypothetical protein
MTYGIYIMIYSEDNTLRSDLSMLLPDMQDYRVAKFDKIRIGDDGFGRYAASGRVKCKTKDQCIEIINNLVSLAEKNRAKIEEGSSINLHYSYHDEKNEKPCSLIPYWIK